MGIQDVRLICGKIVRGICIAESVDFDIIDRLHILQESNALISNDKIVWALMHKAAIHRNGILRCCNAVSMQRQEVDPVSFFAL